MHPVKCAFLAGFAFAIMPALAAQAADPEVRRRLAEAREAARELSERVNAIVRRLRPETLDDLGLASALTVLADGGVRSGLDVVRMLALGAQGVLLGRAWAFALAGGGQAGVAHMLALIQAEMRVAMALTGTTRIAALSRENLVDP